MRQSLQWVVRGSSGLGLGLLLAGCAGESLAPSEEAAFEADAGEQPQAIVKEVGCEGMTAQPPPLGRYQFIHVKAGTDATIRSTKPNTRFGNDSHCYASFDDQDVCLMRFPVNLPKTAQIHFAQLSMRVDSAVPAKYFVYSLDKRWTEAGATWNRYTSLSEWTAPGAAQDQRAPFCTLTSGVGRINYNLNGYAVSQIQDWVSGRAENSGIGFFTNEQSSNTRLDVYSSENEPDDQPELNLWYTDEPRPAQTVTLSATESTTIDKAKPTTNFAADEACEVLRGDPALEKNCLLRWNVSVIPPGSLVTRVAFNFGRPPTVLNRWDLYPLRRAWVEKQATWNEFATGSPWKKGGAYDLTDTSNTVGEVFPASGTDMSITAGSFALVQRWVNDSSTNLGALFGPLRQPRLNIQPWVLSSAPTLTVTFTPP